MQWKSAYTEAFAILASYLIISISVVSATTIRFYDSSGLEIGSPVSYPRSSIVSESVSVDAHNMSLMFSLTNGSAEVRIEGVWLYRCLDRGLSACIEYVTPAVFSGNVHVAYDWASVSAGSPERANLLYFVKASKNGRVVWEGMWTTVTREESGFIVAENDISEVGVYANDIDILSTIRQFIETYAMIPANPEWISRIVFSGASVLHIIEADESGFSDSGGLQYRDVSGDSISGLTRAYGFPFSVTGGNTNNAISLYLNPSYTCGMLGCESEIGENSANCCLDCGCPEGYYCDTSLGCKPESSIALSLYGSTSPKVSNCYESHELIIPVKIDNAPSSYTIKESWCKIGGSYRQCSCETSGDKILCSMTVPLVEECDSGEFRVSDNSIRLNIGFMNGSMERSIYIETPFPDITVGSFVCGSYGCETGLGENQENCCLDCGCPEGRYCNYASGTSPSSAECEERLSELNFVIKRISPDHFSSHNPNDVIYLNMEIENKPKTLSVGSVACNMECSGADSCSASCYTECAEAPSSDEGIYNMSCTLRFTISGYDQRIDYELYPVLIFNVEYRDGIGGYIEDTIEKAVNQISVGAHWCGDGMCGPDENRTSCCYD